MTHPDELARSQREARRYALLAPVAFAAFVILGACTIAQVPKGDPRCTLHSQCVNDPAPAQSDIDTCNQALESNCAAEYRALLDCVAAHQTCGPDGNSDPGAIRAACSSEDATYKNCVPAPPSGGMPDASRVD